ncbi:hypothetical protein [Pantoea sp. 1.19]|uniref:hypothetical protein n=1 Tax=Pantoea sp. 1.19 TaxID=1925589 RepID=UPI000948C723|nr:hypothetical protein [Pantoea sp. 1.19]
MSARENLAARRLSEKPLPDSLHQLESGRGKRQQGEAALPAPPAMTGQREERFPLPCPAPRGGRRRFYRPSSGGSAALMRAWQRFASRQAAWRAFAAAGRLVPRADGQQPDARCLAD